jgi:hypothetical protein
MFAKLFQRFLHIRTTHYEEMKDKIGGSRIHIPIPVVADDGELALAALIHGFWAIYLGYPDRILRISSERVEYAEIVEAEDCVQWQGPVYDQEFEENEERLLETSVKVFDSYLSKSRGELVREYSENFLAITPPEFLSHYRELNPDFLDWLLHK